MSIFNGRAIDIEDNRNKTQVIDENSTDIQYPSAKAVFESQKVLCEELANQNDMVANALKGAASGTFVCMTDVSPIEHNIKVELNPYSYEEVVELAEYNDVVANQDITFEGKSKIVVDFSITEGSTRLIPIIDGVATETSIYIGIGAVSVTGNVALSIDGSILSWSLVQVYPNGEKYTLNGTADISSGSLITGFTIVDGDASTIKVSEVAMRYVTLYKGGKNLFNEKLGYIQSTTCTMRVKDGNSFTAKGNVGTSKNNWDTGQMMFPNVSYIKETGVSVKRGAKYTFSFDYLLIEQGTTYKTNEISIVGYRTTKTSTTTLGNAVPRSTPVGKTTRCSVPFTIPPDAPEDVKMSVAIRLNNNYVTISNVQIEEGNTGTEFEPYVEPTECVINADGTANVPSLYPTTRLYTDTEGVTIEAEYNRDINKAFAELQAAIINLGGI